MLKKIKEDYFSKNVQFILTDYDGVVLDSDQTLLEISIGTPLDDIHAFFTCISSLQEEKEKTIFFNCVQLGINEMEFIVDIEMTKKKESILVMIHDLTEHYRSYQAIAQARNESIINSELIVMKNIELEEREKFKNQFIRNFSHELRNPLTSIVAITDVIQATGLSVEQQKMVNFLKDSNTNLRLMLEDILSISMIASGKLQLNIKIFNLTQLLELIKFTYHRKAKEKRLVFNMVCDDKVPESIEGDRLRLYQILTNLLENAFNCTDKGMVSLEVRFNQKWANKVSLRFRVSDTGIGIPKENIEHIFESFSQLDTNKKNGTGLGLPIVKGLLEHMKSKIKVESTLEKGSVFHFDLVLKEPLHLPDTSIKKRKRGKAQQGKEQNYRILLVEDDEQVQMMLFKILLAQKCFKIDFQNDGAKVMEAVVNNSYDLILMDIKLPNVDGDNIVRLIRSFPFKNIKKIPIVGITANAYPDEIVTYKNAGMNTVISKPFDEAELLDAIFTYLN